MTHKPIYTIGHSNHPIDRFISLLKQHAVDAIADVRSSPFSKHNPQFNRSELRKHLKNNDISYVFLGNELGARSQNSEDYENNRVSYKRLASHEEFRSGIERILTGSKKHTVAIMCAEKEPLDCHRTILVAQALGSRGAEIEHILADGRIESQEFAIDRLVRELVPSTGDLFSPNSNPVAEALRIREEQIAYVRQGEKV